MGWYPVAVVIIIALLFLNIGARGGGWSTPSPGRFTPGKETRYPLYRRLLNLSIVREITNSVIQDMVFCVFILCHVVFRCFEEKCCLHRTVDMTVQKPRTIIWVTPAVKTWKHLGIQSCWPTTGLRFQAWTSQLPSKYAENCPCIERLDNPTFMLT
jgi:hypothetical protein